MRADETPNTHDWQDVADAMEAEAQAATPPFSDENPCPKCRTGLCHRCAYLGPDAVIAPHMGVVLCSRCFMGILSRG